MMQADGQKEQTTQCEATEACDAISCATHSATATSPTRLDDARDLHQRGCLEAAKEVYLEILARDPKHADAWHLLGMLLYQGGHAKSALECLHKADALGRITPSY